MDRVAKVQRVTSEVRVSVDLNIDGSGNYNIDTGLKYFY